MPRSQPGVVWEGHWRSVYELAPMVGLTRQALYRWHYQGTLTAEHVRSVVRERELRRHARSLGISAKAIQRRTQLYGWTFERACVQPLRHGPNKTNAQAAA